MSHARLAPSAAERWRYCAAAPDREQSVPDTGRSIAAVDGTGSHVLFDLAWRQQAHPSTWVGQTVGVGHHDQPEGWTVDAARAQRVAVMYDYLTRRQESLPGCNVSVELRVDAGRNWGIPDWWGTADAIITFRDYLEIVDLKDGRMWVGPRGNPQLLTYLAGAAGLPWLRSGSRRVQLTIVQPKLSPAIKTWGVPVTSALLRKLDVLAQAAQATHDDPTRATPGTHCKYCNFKRHCREYAAWTSYEGVKYGT